MMCTVINKKIYFSSFFSIHLASPRWIIDLPREPTTNLVVFSEKKSLIFDMIYDDDLIIEVI